MMYNMHEVVSQNVLYNAKKKSFILGKNEIVLQSTYIVLVHGVKGPCHLPQMNFQVNKS